MKSVVVLGTMLIYYQLLAPIAGQRLTPPRSYYSEHNDEEDDDEDGHRLQLDGNGDEMNNNHSTTQGMYLGAPCKTTCHPKLLHVYCNLKSGICDCEKNYPVRLNPYKGCGKPKRLGDQCYYRESCQYSDQHSDCVQIHHNAICQCHEGYHSVAVQKPSKRVFCAEDLVVMTTDFSTFASVLSGIAVLSGLICFVLHLFNQNLYGTGRHRFANANLAPPILFSSDAGSLPMPIIDRSLTSRTSSRRTLASLQSRRASSGITGPATRGISASRTVASRRPSLASVHSVSSVRSYSARRYEREREQKEERELQRRLAGMTASQNSIGRTTPTPSPHSTDDLLPPLKEQNERASWVGIVPPLAIQEESSTSFHEDIPSTSKQYQ